MSQWSKLLNEVINLNKNLRFEELAKILLRIGYTQSQPKGGSSHYIFRKKGKNPISIPKGTPIKRAYIELVRIAINEHESEV